MDNATRSERSRKAVLEAALAIIGRDGPGRLTLDAIARQCGISKGGVMHQFPTKEAVLKALLDLQIAYFKDDEDDLRASGEKGVQFYLRNQIERLRDAIDTPRSAVFAVLAVAAQEPGLMGVVRETDIRTAEHIKAQAPDPDLAILRWLAAWGLTLTTQLGLSPLSEGDRKRLFDRLIEDRYWQAVPATTRARKAGRAGAPRTRRRKSR